MSSISHPSAHPLVEIPARRDPLLHRVSENLIRAPILGSGFVALVYEIRRHGVVAGTRQYPAQVDELLSVDVLVVRTPENLGLFPDPEQKHVVVLLLYRSDRLQQGDDIVPFDVVVRFRLKDLEQGVSVMAAEMLRT